MKKMTRLASGKTGKTDLRWLSFDPFGEVIGSYQKKGVEEGARDLRIKVPSGQERTDLLYASGVGGEEFQLGKSFLAKK